MFEISPLLIPIFALMIPIVAIITSHLQKMAGVSGKDGAGLRQTVDLLTQTLEKQHVRQQALQQRIETLEAIVTSEQGAGSLTASTPRLTLPEADASGAERDPSGPARTRT